MWEYPMLAFEYSGTRFLDKLQNALPFANVLSLEAAKMYLT